MGIRSRFTTLMQKKPFLFPVSHISTRTAMTQLEIHHERNVGKNGSGFNRVLFGTFPFSKTTVLFEMRFIHLFRMKHRLNHVSVQVPPGVRFRSRTFPRHEITLKFLGIFLSTSVIILVKRMNCIQIWFFTSKMNVSWYMVEVYFEINHKQVKWVVYYYIWNLLCIFT